MKEPGHPFWKLFIILLFATVFAGRSQAAPGSTNADLQINITSSTNYVMAGQQFSFTLFFTNAGPSSVFTQVTVNDFLPGGLIYITNFGSGTYNSGSGQWTLSPGAPGTAQTLTITVKASSPGTYTNTAYINVPPGVTDTNLSNNTSSVPVTVTSSTPISIYCPGNIAVQATNPNGAVVYFSIMASGGCSPPPNVTANPPSGSTFPIGTTTVYATASDTCGDVTNCNFTVTVTNNPIVLNCSTNLFVSATSSNGATVFFYVSATGGCSPPNIIANPPSGSTFPIGTTTVTTSAYDSCGESNRCSFTVTVTNTPIQLNCSSNIAVSATNSNGAIVFFTVTASGGCSPPPYLTANPPSGSTFPIGTTTVFTTASDSCGNHTNCSFTVTVTNTPIQLNCSSNIAVAATSSNGATVFFSVMASGGCGPPSIIANPPSGSFFPIGTTTVTSTAHDSCGQSNQCSFTVTVVSTNATNISADLQVTKTASTNRVIVGKQVVFTVQLQNLGPNSVTNEIVVTDCLPTGYEYVTDSTYGGGGIGTYSPGTCWWTLPNGLGANSSATLQITVQATNTGTYTNIASVAVPPGVTDPNLTNNTASVVLTNTLPKADLQIIKTVDSTNIQTGQQVNFTLALQNLGPDYVSNDIVVSDCLPPGLTYITDNTIGGTGINGTYSPGTCLWTLSGGLGTNFIVYLTVTAQAVTNLCITNTATLQVPMGIIDPNTNNNVSLVNFCINSKYTLTGSVRNCSSNGSPLPNVTVTLTGLTNAITLTDSNGNYTFSNLFAGNYTVTPSQPGNAFMPASANITLNGSSNLPVFAGSTPLIQGTVTYGTNGSPIVGVPVKVTGPINITVLTGTNGQYIVTNTPPGNYTVTPLATNGFVFTPTNKALTLSATNCSGVANFVSSNRTVQLVALEVTQVIQDWSNSVPLIAAKKTYVRAHIQVPTNNVPSVLVQGARLYGTGPHGPLPGSPLSCVNSNGSILVSTTNAAALRPTWTNSLNFQLPMSWTAAGPVTLQFVWSNNVTLVFNAPQPAGGTNGIANVTFNAASMLPLKFYAFNWTNGGTFQKVNAAAYADLPRRLVSMYPVPDATRAIAVQAPAQTLSVPATIPKPLTDRGEKLADWALLLSNSKLAWIRFVDQWGGSWFGRQGSNYLYYGVLAGPSPGTEGWANAFLSSSNTVVSEPRFIASGFVEAEFYNKNRHTHDHEIGHTLSRPHDVFANGKGACGEGGPKNTAYPLFQTVTGVYTNKPAIGPMNLGYNAMIYGLDTLTLETTNYNAVVNPSNYFDVMSYCDVAPLDVWISPFTYAAMRTNINNNFTNPPPAVGPARKYMVIRGYIDPATDDVTLMPSWSLTTTTAPPAPAPGNYEIQYYDASSNLLGQVTFTPEQYDVEEGDDGKEIEELFLVPVPDDGNNISQIAIYDGPTLLTTVSAPPSSPVVSGVTLASTNGFAYNGTGPLTVNWSGIYSGSNTVYYTVQYSTDNGSTWNTLETDWTNQTYTVDSGFLLPTTQGMVRVFATDGFNTSDPAYSVGFTIANHPPTLSIIQPMNGTLYIGDQQIFLETDAMDAQDGLLDNGNVQWTSDLDGYLGSGASLNFEAGTLSEGAHTITVTATDSLGLTNSMTVQIFVLRLPPPQLSIEYLGSPANQVQLSWPSASTNFVLESTTSLTSPNWTPVPAIPVVNGDTQSVTLNISSGTLFFRLRME